MTRKLDEYRSADTPLPSPNLGWNTYGVGIESMGTPQGPEPIDVPPVGPDQLLIRIDAVGLCFSDVKLIRQGRAHPKLYGRDLMTDPTRLGHEATVTVIEVGENLRETYHHGQRLAIQPDIHVDGRPTAYGYTIPGGLIQYHLIGPEVLAADDGAYVIPVEDEIGYAAAALSEPWACVEAAYTQRRRLDPLPGGVMWIVGQRDDASYQFSAGLDAPAKIVLTDVSPAVAEMVEAGRTPDTTVLVHNAVDDLAALSDEITAGQGFDDIVVLDPRSGAAVSEMAKLIAFRGTMNLVGTVPLDEKPQIDVGRIHYHYTAYVGTTGPDIAAAYGEARNRADLKVGGVAVIVGAGGPMGQMHIQRALELPDGPGTIIASDLDDDRLSVVRERLLPMAERLGRTMVVVNPAANPGSLDQAVKDLTDGRGADDVIVSVPVASVMGDAADLMAPDGMLVLFAGVPNGSMAPLDLSDVYLHNAQFTGTSGSKISDQAVVLGKAIAGKLSPQRSLAAVGGIEAARDGVQAMLDGTFAGKIVIFPQLTGLPLMGLPELGERYPDIGRHLEDGDIWTAEAEKAFIERFWG
jgi:threonine dehydrogenase-like Zn-dependent dehydrogenase